MDLTVANLVEALATSTSEPVDDLADIVGAVRQAQPTFAVTIFSAWEAEGRTLSPSLRWEVQAARDRIAFYHSVLDKLRSAMPSLRTVKGLEVGELYPAGLIRYQNDMDIIAPSEAELWQAVALVTDLGWEVRTATFAKVGGVLQVMVNTWLQNEDEYQMAYHIEFASYFSLGNHGGIPPVLRFRDEWLDPASIKNFLMLLHERYEQRFRARDLIDAALLGDSFTDANWARFHEGVIALGLAVAYDELVGLVGKTSLPPLRPLPGGPLVTNFVRARRAARGAGLFAKPVAGTGHHLQRRNMTGKQSRAEGRAWDTMQRQLPVTKAVDGGLLAFGLPLGHPSPELTTAVLRSRGQVAWADTPACRFLLTIGDYVTQEAIDELTEPEPGG